MLIEKNLNWGNGIFQGIYEHTAKTISLIRIRSVNTPDLQTRREGRYGRTTLLNTIMVIIMLL